MSTQTRSALIVKATKETYCELKAIEEAFTYHEVKMDIIDLTKPDTNMVEEFSKMETSWNYVYLCAHGSEEGFGDESLGIEYDWGDLSAEICTRLDVSATFMLACCRGGFSHIAYHLFANCRSIATIIGPRYSAYSGDLRVGFQAFLHHLEARRNDPTVAAKAASAAAGIEFILYDALETTTSLAFLNWSEYDRSYLDGQTVAPI